VAPAGADVVDRVVLRVNDQIATLLDYERRHAEFVQQLEATDMPEDQRAQARANIGNRIFRDMLEELLLISRADQLGIYPTEEQVDRGVQAVRQQYGIASDDEFAAALASQGLSLAEFREQVREQLRMREVVTREVTEEIELEEDDLRRVYRATMDRYRVPERYRVRELIVLEEGRDPAAVRALADEIRAELIAGRDFQELADEHAATGDTSHLLDHGWISTGELDPDLEAAIAELAPGSFSDPVPGRGGLHLIELQEQQDSRVRGFGEVASQIAADERQRLYMEHIGDYMRDLEEAAYVRAEPPPEAAGFRTVAGSRSEQDPFADFESDSPSDGSGVDDGDGSGVDVGPVEPTGPVGPVDPAEPEIDMDELRPAPEAEPPPSSP
jgi:peptidyl-prolyl cis-trans isomerase SurA